MKHIIFLLMLSFFTGVLFAENSAASICENKETVVFFGNGVKTVEKKAYDASNKIKEKLEAVMPTEEFKKLEFNLAYNDTHGLPLDLLESSVQFLTGNISGFWRFFWHLIPAPDWFTDKLLVLSSALDKTALVTTDSLWEHVRTYKTVIAEGQKVVLVAHSQGNFFGNLAYDNLNSTERRSFGMVGVANVDSNVLMRDYPYTTLVDDKVVQALITAQLILPTKPMEPNTENLYEASDSLGHAFLEAYMVDDSISGDQITNQIIATIEGLPDPPKVVEKGVITVSLTWGSEPDVDLHVYEPNGMQVFWYNLDGYSGFLDRDDRSGYGPEHYTVPTCETLETGAYEVALDYFKGYGPEVATVQIKAGLLVRTFEVPMSSEAYGSVAYPVHTAYILVSRGENGGFDFAIR